MNIDNLININTEELRLDLCLLEYKPAEFKILKIKDKFAEIIEMMNKQMIVHESWDDVKQKPSEVKR